MPLAKADVPGEFDRVARSYEYLTGLNPGYRRHLRLSAARLDVPSDGDLLDLCCGTGASTRALLAEHPDARMTAADGSAGMLAEARRRLPEDRVRLLQADAMNPRASGIAGPFDAIMMAYGIRNMSDPDRCLANLLEILRPGGSICFHEYSEPYRRAIESHLADTVLPGLPDEVVTSRLMTPFHFRDELLSFQGAAFSFEPILSQSAWFRPHNRSEDVEGLYLVGAGTHPGAGVPGVLSSARVLDSVVPDPESHRS